MKWVQRVQTADGVLHDDERRAHHHADRRYTDAASNMAGQLVKIEKYMAMKEFIDEHLDEFIALKALKQDMELEPTEDA